MTRKRLLIVFYRPNTLFADWNIMVDIMVDVIPQLDGQFPH